MCKKYLAARTNKLAATTGELPRNAGREQPLVFGLRQRQKTNFICTHRQSVIFLRSGGAGQFALCQFFDTNVETSTAITPSVDATLKSSSRPALPFSETARFAEYHCLEVNLLDFN